MDLLSGRLDDLASRRRSGERTAAEFADTLQKVESRLYGGEVTGERELLAVQEEHVFIKRSQSESEDGLLEIMVEIDEVESEHRDAVGSLERFEATRPDEEAELRATEKKMMAELEILGKNRDAMTPLLSADILSRYDVLLDSKDGTAVAMVERGMCQGCRLTLSTMELQRARSSQVIVQCSSCRRILYVV